MNGRPELQDVVGGTQRLVAGAGAVLPLYKFLELTRRTVFRPQTGSPPE
jgi:hypothetical protein